MCTSKPCVRSTHSSRRDLLADVLLFTLNTHVCRMTTVLLCDHPTLISRREARGQEGIKQGRVHHEPEIGLSRCGVLYRGHRDVWESANSRPSGTQMCQTNVESAVVAVRLGWVERCVQTVHCCICRVTRVTLSPYSSWLPWKPRRGRHVTLIL